MMATMVAVSLTIGEPFRYLHLSLILSHNCQELHFLLEGFESCFVGIESCFVGIESEALSLSML